MCHPPVVGVWRTLSSNIDKQTAGSGIGMIKEPEGYSRSNWRRNSRPTNTGRVMGFLGTVLSRGL